MNLHQEFLREQLLPLSPTLCSVKIILDLWGNEILDNSRMDVTAITGTYTDFANFEASARIFF